MLIVCPSCATSYMIDPAALPASGRNVRCARCKTTWFAGAPKPGAEVRAFVDSVIAEAEAKSSEAGAGAAPCRSAKAPEPPRPRTTSAASRRITIDAAPRATA